MLSSYLAQQGLEAVTAGNYNIVSEITQSEVIEAMKTSPKFAEKWNSAVKFAESKCESEQDVVAITLYHLCFHEVSLYKINDRGMRFDLSWVNDSVCVSIPSEDMTDLVKVRVVILLF